MNAHAHFPHQRAQGEILLRTARTGLVRMRESGAAKVRFPAGGNEAILINTGGGLAEGDSFRFTIAAEVGARLSVTTQAAERVYRSLGATASVKTSLDVEADASLAWLPQETIFFDGAALNRELEADVAVTGSLLVVESIVFGRLAMGETVSRIHLRERWRIRQDGRLIHADDVAISGPLPHTSATLGEHLAMASLVLVAQDAESRVDAIRAAIGKRGSASAWNGKLVARMLAQDGFELRKALLPALAVLAGKAGLPKVWSM